MSTTNPPTQPTITTAQPPLRVVLIPESLAAEYQRRATRHGASLDYYIAWQLLALDDLLAALKAMHRYHYRPDTHSLNVNDRIKKIDHMALAAIAKTEGGAA